MARPSKLTDEAVDKFLSAIRAGSFPEAAATYAGFSAASYYRYMQARTPEGTAFREAVFKERGKLEVQLTASLVQGALRDPRLALKVLALLFPERWAQRPPPTPGNDGGAETAPAAEPASLDPTLIEQLIPRILDVGERLRAAGNHEPGARVTEAEPRRRDPRDEEGAA